MGRGLHLGHAINSIAFLDFLCGIFNQGGHLGLGQNFRDTDAESVPLPIKRLPKHIYGSFAGIPTRNISHRGLFLQNEGVWGYVGERWVLL